MVDVAWENRAGGLIREAIRILIEQGYERDDVSDYVDDLLDDELPRDRKPHVPGARKLKPHGASSLE